MKFLHLLIAGLVFLLSGLPAQAQVKSLLYKEEKRRYLLYTPASYQTQSDKKFPLVLNFHGGGMSMAEQMLYTQMNQAADQFGYIVVYPQGIKQDWNVGFGMSYLEGTDDTGFVLALLAKLKESLRINEQAVFVSGLSRGGFFSLRLAAEYPQLFKAAAAVGATMPLPVLQHHPEHGANNILLIQGEADQIVLAAGKDQAYLSAEASYQHWLNKAQLQSASEQVEQRDQRADDGTSLTLRSRANTKHRVSLISLAGAGHTWPGADAFNLGLPLGKTSYELNANQTIFEFFNSTMR